MTSVDGQSTADLLRLDAEHGAARPDPGTVVLAEPDATRRPDEPLRMWRIVTPIAIAAVIVALVVGAAGSLVSRQIAEQQAVHDVAQLTDVLAESLIQPALTDRVPTSVAAARRILDPIVRPRLRHSGLIRVKVWAPDGTVVYSDRRALVGRRFVLESEEREAFMTPRLEAGISDLRRPENRYERDQGKLLEVYRPVWTPDGAPLLFETYFRYATVTQRSHQLWRGFGGIMLTSLAALLLLLAPLGWALLVRARRARAQRDELTQRALDASEDERRRIAATLHDGAVQQLAAASFTAAGYAERAAAGPDARLAVGLTEVSATVRDSIAGLRSLLVDIYPPSLRTSGLSAALGDLARSVAGNEADVRVEVDAAVADALAPQTQEAVYRVAQEALRNAARHAGARRLTMELRAIDAEWAGLEVARRRGGFRRRNDVRARRGRPLRPAADGRCGAPRQRPARRVQRTRSRQPDPDGGDPRMTGVLIVDDHRLVRAGLRSLLDAAPDIEVVGEAADGEQAVRAVAEHAPDVVLMDLSMPVLDGVGATRALLAEHPDTRVVVLTTFSDRRRVGDALAAGAVGYLLKDCAPGDLLAAVRAAARGRCRSTPASRARCCRIRQRRRATCSATARRRFSAWPPKVWRTSRSAGGSASASAP